MNCIDLVKFIVSEVICTVMKENGTIESSNAVSVSYSNRYQ
ncbi:hypothetical protein ACIG6B_17930 [Bacillus mobilis]